MSSQVLPPGASLNPRVVMQRRRRRFWLVAAVVLLIVASLAVPPAYRKSKQWRARGLAAEAEKLILDRQFKSAIAKAQAAFELAPREAASLRAIARVHSLGGSALAMGYWKSLLALPEATAQDRREAVRFALKTDRLDFAEDQLQFLLQGDPSDAETLELAAQMALQRDDRAGALEYVGRLLARNPAQEGAALLQAQLLAGSRDSAEQARGRRALFDLGRGKDATALSALLQLAQKTPLSTEEALTVDNALTAHPLAGPAEKLVAVSLRLRQAPARRTELIEQTCAQFGHGSPDELVALGRWLLQQGEPSRVAELISPAQALERQELFLVRLDALAALGDWTKIQQSLEKEKPPIAPFYVQIFLARAARQLGQDEDANAHWTNALADAVPDPQQTHYLAQYAEKAGEPRIAEKAWRQLARTPAWSLRARLALLSLLQAAGDTRALRDEVQQVVKLAPEDPAARNDAAYLDLLLRENADAAEQTARRLVREHPEVLAYRSTLALALLRKGEGAEALRLYEGLDIPWDQAPIRSQAIHKAVLFAAGVVFSRMPVESLLPEERALLEGLPAQK